MTQVRKVLVLWCCLLVAKAPLQAEDSIGIIAGKGMSDLLIQSGSTAGARVQGFAYRNDSIQPTFAPLLAQFDWLEDTSALLDFELYQMTGEHITERYETNIVALKPTLHWRSSSRVWFAEFGLGVGYLDAKRFEEIETSSHWQFAIHAGVGANLGDSSDWMLAIRYNHFSNGYLDQPNPGLDFITLNLLYQL